MHTANFVCVTYISARGEILNATDGIYVSLKYISYSVSYVEVEMTAVSDDFCQSAKICIVGVFGFLHGTVLPSFSNASLIISVLWCNTRSITGGSLYIN